MSAPPGGLTAKASTMTLHRTFRPVLLGKIRVDPVPFGTD
jgi:hypothetical protein